MREIEAYLDGIPMWAHRKNSLADIRRFLDAMGSPDGGPRIVHVAGTNGKGSVCAYLTSIFLRAGYTVCTFISPHLETVRERILTDGEMVPEEEFGEAFERVRALAEEQRRRGMNPPAYFEFLFYMFMEVCRLRKPDIAVLETGLGGRLDATNAVREPALAVLTSISMDHTRYLGDTLEKIAGEKAGILKAGVPAVYDAVCPEARAVFERRAAELGCPAFPVAETDRELLGRSAAGTRIAVRMTDGGWLETEIPSQAEYQMMNAAVAVRAAEVLSGRGTVRLAPEDISEGIRRGRWPGRMEEVLPGVYLDGAHNEGGARALAETMRRLQRETGEPVSLMFGVMSDKDYRRMIPELCRGIRLRRVTVSRPLSGRAAYPAEVSGIFRRETDCPVAVFDTVRDAWEDLLAHKGKGPAFCAGSLYLVGEVKALLREETGHD